MGRGNGAGCGAVAGVGLILSVVLCRPLRGCFVCPFDVAGLDLVAFVLFLQLGVVRLSGNQC